jgi:ribosome-associated heat shock protein Hsp15
MFQVFASVKIQLRPHRAQAISREQTFMEPIPDVRIDRWLWAVRIYKTRSIASQACRAGHVQIAGQKIKASRTVKINEIITAKTGAITRTLKVLGPIQQRVSATLAKQFVDDQTPAAELEKLKEKNFTPAFLRPKGAGRPTKKDRRKIQPFFD